MNDLLFRGVTILIGLIALMAAGEMAFGPSPEELRSIFAGLMATAAITLLVGQYFYYSGRSKIRRYRAASNEMTNEILGYQSQVKALERDRQYLRQQVESLSAHREISRAATAHTSFEDFLDEVAGVVRDLAGAKDISVFVCDAASATRPMAYYSLARACELCLTFNETGGVALMDGMDIDHHGVGNIDSELLKGRKLSITPMGAQVVVSAALSYRDADVGTAKLTLHHLDPDNLPSGDMIASLLATELGHVRIDNRNLKEATGSKKPVHYDGQARVMELACPLNVDRQTIGVVKVRFDCRGDNAEIDAMGERERILGASAAHIARAIRSERIYEQAIKDGLTGLYNKRYMITQLEGYFRVASRHGTHLSIILIDIDHFKSVNDTHGHLTGDMVLRDVSKLMMDGIRDCDLPCRYGGEELAIILPEGSLDGSIGLAERIRKKIESFPFKTDKGDTIQITASLGVAEHLPTMRRIEDLIAHADASLYEAKETGRNQAIAWTEKQEKPVPPQSAKISARKPARRKEDG